MATKDPGCAPVLPPGWVWHPKCGQPTMTPSWRALGPTVSGRWPLEAWAATKALDGPEGCSEAAWGLWEILSGCTRSEGEMILRVRAQMRYTGSR